MKRKRIGGFSAVEMVAVVAVLLILAAIIAVPFVSGKAQAVHLRRTNAAATLNAAEHALLDFNSTTAAATGQASLVVSATPLERILALKAAGFLVTLISTEDVTLVQTNGLYYWVPVRP